MKFKRKWQEQRSKSFGACQVSNFSIKLESQLFQLLSVSIPMCKWVRERMEEEREQTMLGLF